MWADNGADNENKTEADLHNSIIRIEHPTLGWPNDDVIKRFHLFKSQQNMLKMMDYVFSFDADVVCKQVITGMYTPTRSL